MGKKMGENSKAVEAREKKGATKAAQKQKQVVQEEDEYWKQAGEGAKSKAQLKKEEQEKQRAEAAAKKVEAKKLAEEEERQLAQAAQKKLGKVALPKVSAHQLSKIKEMEAKQEETEKQKRAAAAKRMVTEDSYSQLVEVENVNREEDLIDARNVTQAIAALSLAEQAEEDKHPERRLKAAFAAYQERELPLLKQEKPGLKQSQYKDMMFKAWQKSPDNPMNKAQLQ
ncbi:hypothetical protein WJX72_001671 [[Myrmecia] bisecta]|uniref:Coiled-coil domain-containing protein n=1 Tax=[Myrmecia] bisecta TaxID=41462 RepID=A0AAW1PDA6_9CHLO